MPIPAIPVVCEQTGSAARLILSVEGSTVTLYIEDATGVRTPLGFAALTVAGDVVATLPEADPGVEGQLWSNAGVVTVSAGA